MSDLAMVWLNLIVGILLGAFFFGGLWWTVRKVVAGDGMEFWLSISLLIRSSVTLAVSAGRFGRLYRGPLNHQTLGAGKGGFSCT